MDRSHSRMTDRPPPSDVAPRLVVLNQMAGPMTWELAVDLAKSMPVAMLTGHPDSLAKEPPEGLNVWPGPAYRRGRLITRTWSWARYCLCAFWWMWKWPADTPVLVFSNPPVGPWIAAIIQWMRGTRYAVMVHDIYPDVVIKMGLLRESNWAIRIWRALNRRAYQRAALVMTLGEKMARVLDSQMDATRTDAGSIQVVYPWADTERFHPLDKKDNPFANAHKQSHKITVMYSGNMGIGHDIETMLQAAEILRPEQRLHFMFIGAGPKWKAVQRTIREKNLTNVTLLPWQDESVIPHSLATADVGLVSLEPELSALAIPSKAFYFLATGTPILVLSTPDTELATIIENHQCGWVQSPGDVDALVRVLLAIAQSNENMPQRSQASRKAAMAIGNRETNAQQIGDLLTQHLMNPPSQNKTRPAD